MATQTPVHPRLAPPRQTASSLTALLYAELGYKPDEITDRLMNELRLTRRQQELLRPWIRDRVQHEISRLGRSQGSGHRAEVLRDRERQRQEGRATTRSQRVHYQEGPLDFLDCQVPCPGAEGGMKLYRHFTVADHKQRLTVHRTNLEGAQRRITGHEWAIAEIEKNKVRTLDELTERKLLADLPQGGITP